MRYRILIFVYAVLLGFSLSPLSRGQEGTEVFEEPKFVVRTYPVADLIDGYAIATSDSTQWPGNRLLPKSVSNTPSFSSSAGGAGVGLGGGMGGMGGGMGGMGGGMGGGGMFQVPDVTVKNPNLSQMGEASGAGMSSGGMGGMSSGGMGAVPSRSFSIQSGGFGDELVQTLVSMVAPDSWELNGGQGTLALFRGSLIVRNSEAVQEEVMTTLESLRESSGLGRPVTLQWSLVDTSVLAESEENKRLTSEQVKAIAKLSGTIQCLNHQNVEVLRGTHQLLVTSVTPVVGADSSVGYSPQTAKVLHGWLLQFSPSLPLDAEGHAQIRFSMSWGAPTPSDGPSERVEIAPGVFIDRGNVTELFLAGSVGVAADQWVNAGSLHNSEDGSSVAAPNVSLLLKWNR